MRGLENSAAAGRGFARSRTPPLHPSMTTRLRKRTWTLVLVAAFIPILLWIVIRQMLDVAAVQDAVQRDWEMAFTHIDGEQFARPQVLPKAIDDAVDHLLTKRYPDPREFQNHVSYRYSVYLERFRAMFRGRIREIRIYDPEGFRGDLGAALQRFPGLRLVEVHDLHTSLPSEKEWELLCRRLRELPDLETLHLQGRWITDAAIAPLAAHPRLRSLAITWGTGTGLTPACLKTFAAIPNLKELNIVAQNPGDGVWITQEVQAELAAALPGIVISTVSKD